MARLLFAVAALASLLAPLGPPAKADLAPGQPPTAEHQRYGERIRQIVINQRDSRVYAIIGKGTAVVSFVVDRAGKLVQIGIARSSRNGGYDAEAIAIVRRASRWFPAAPASLDDAYFGFSLPISFESIHDKLPGAAPAASAEDGSITTFVSPRSEARRP